MVKRNHDHDHHDHDHDHNHDHDIHDNDNSIANKTPVPVTPKAGALGSVSLAALAATFKKVDTTPIGGRSALPLMLFKSREGGIYTFGQRQTRPEPNSLWAANPASFMWGWVCWNDGGKRLGEKLVPIDQPLPDIMEMPDKGFPWQQEMTVNLKCISGTDAGVEVVFKTNTEGGKAEVTRLINEVRDRFISGQHGNKVSPILTFERDNYDGQYGKTWIPIFNIVDWMPLGGPAPAPEPAAPSPKPPTSTTSAAEQPRRRRVG